MIGLAPGASPIDLTGLSVAFSTPDTAPVILRPGDSATMTTFTAKEAGAGTSLDSITNSQQIEIDFMVTAVPKNTPATIGIRPPVGAALPFSKITDATITKTTILF